jgi:hypothetical protein
MCSWRKGRAMSLPYRHQRDLLRIARALRRSDPHLASMFLIFTRISADEELPRREQLRTPLALVWAFLIWPADAGARLAMLAASVAHRFSRCAAAVGRAVWNSFCGRVLRRDGARPVPASTGAPSGERQPRG